VGPLRRWVWLLPVAALTAHPVGLAGQLGPRGAHRLAVDVGAGIGIPGAVISDELGVGPAVGGGLSYVLGHHLAVRTDLDVAFERGKTLPPTSFLNQATSTQTEARTLYHYTLGIEVFLAAPWESAWWASGLIALGGTSWTGSAGAAGHGPWFTAGAGIRLGRRLSSRMSLWGGVKGYGFIPSGSAHGAVDANIPILAGLRIAL
jgi:hypothetical protein